MGGCSGGGVGSVGSGEGTVRWGGGGCVRAEPGGCVKGVGGR